MFRLCVGVWVWVSERAQGRAQVMGGGFPVHFLSRPDQFYSTFIDYHVQKHFTKPYRDRYMKFLFTEVRGIFKLKQHSFPLKNKNTSLNIKVNFLSNFPYEVNFYQANTFLHYFWKAASVFSWEKNFQPWLKKI